MKRFLAIVCLVLIAVPAFAYNTVGFRAYSTATNVGTTCAVIGGIRAEDGTFVVREVVTMSLGTKGTGSFTPVLNRDYQINCAKTSDGTAAAAKLFFDVEATTFMPLSTFLLRFK